METGISNATTTAEAAYTPGGTDVAVADGGTGSSTASGARTNLGVVVGTDVQAHDADLDSIAALDSSTSGAIASDGAGWIKKTYAQFKTALSLVSSDVGLGSVTNDAQVKLSTATTKGDLYVATGSAAVSRLGVGSDTQVLTADSTQTTGVKWAAGGGGSADKLGLTPTAVKTAGYTAVAGDFVPVDTTSGAVTVTLPTPSDGSVLAVKHVIQGSTNAVTINCAGSDVFNKASGSTSLSLSLLNQGVLLQYKSSSAIWYVVSDDYPFSGLAIDTVGSGTDITTNNVSSTKHGLAPKSPADATKFLNGATTPAYAQPKDSDLSVTDITTNNVSTSAHGFAPKAPNDATKYLDGTGAYTVPAGGGGGALTLLSTTTLGVNGTFDVSSISGSYNDLILVTMVRGSVAAAGDTLLCRLNNDSGANYDWEQLNGQSTTTVSSGNDTQTSSSIGLIAANSASANSFSQVEMTICGYASTTWHKEIHALLGRTWGNAGQSQIQISHTHWLSTAAVNRVTLFGSAAANLLAGSQLRIYGRL